MPEQISTVDEVRALPAECLLRSTRPGYGPTYVVTFDCGDGEVMIGVVDECGTFSAKEVLDEYGPLELVYGPCASEFFAASNDLVWLSEWIDASNAQRDAEARTWGRLAKLAEETGEVIAAFIGLTGQNPRKGVTHTGQDVFDELLDVAVTALGAAEHVAGHQGNVLDGLLIKIHLVAQRAQDIEATQADEQSGPPARSAGRWTCELCGLGGQVWDGHEDTADLDAHKRVVHKEATGAR